MIKLIINNNNKNIVVNSSRNYLFIKSYENHDHYINNNSNKNSSNNNHCNCHNSNNYSTSILKNTKRKSSSERKIKVNHISKDLMKEVYDFQYKYSDPIKKSRAGKSDKARILKEELGLTKKEIDDILDDGSGSGSDTINEFGEADEDGFIKGSNKLKGDVYYSEKITYSTDTSKDNEFIRKSLGGTAYSRKLDGDMDWKIYNEDEDGLDDTPKTEKLKKIELGKKGLEERDGSYYADGYLITNDNESFFLTPDQPNNRKEKNLFRKMDELREAKQQARTKRGFKVNENINDQFVGQTIVQSRLASRILEVLNESPLFSPVSILNSEAVGQEFKFNNEDEFDRNLELLEASKLVGSQVESKSKNFSVESDDLQIDKEDPILSKADIILTHAEMSSDLRWVKLYWKRRSHTNSESLDLRKKSIDDYSKQDALDRIMNVKNEGIKNILDSLDTNSAKHLVYDSYKPIIDQTENRVLSTNKYGSRIITKQKQDEQQQFINNNNNYNNNNNSSNILGFTNSFSIPTKKVELEISIKHTDPKIIERERELEREKLEKRERLLSKILSDDIDGGSDSKDSNNNSEVSNSNSSNNNNINNNNNNNNNNSDITNDPILQQLINSNNTNKTNNNNSHNINNNNNNNNQEKQEEEEEEEDSKKKTKKKKEDIETRREKKFRTLFYEITDKDIQHRLLKLKSSVRWIIGKRVQSKYVPDVMFIKDEGEIKDETTVDMLDNMVPLEFKQLFVDRVKSIEKTKNKLKSKYSSLFYDGGSTTNQEYDEDGLLDDGDYIQEEEIDLHQILESFPTLRKEKAVQKFLRYEKERLDDISIKQQQKQQQVQDQELELEKELEQIAQINNNNNTQQIFKQFNNSNSNSHSNSDNSANVQQIFKQFNKDL